MSVDKVQGMIIPVGALVSIVGIIALLLAALYIEYFID